MKNWLPITFLFVTLLVLLGARGARTQGPPAVVPPVPDEVLVQFARQTPNSRRAAILAAETGIEIRRFDNLDIHHVRLARGRNVNQAVAALLRNPEVVAAQPNYVRQAVGTSGPPNDPLWLDGTLWGLIKIKAQAVWTTYSSGNGTVVIADVDTGINYNHPDLVANVWHNPGEIPGDGIDNDLNGFVDDVYGIDTVNGDTNPMDDHGHGTHTAGTLAGVGNNGIGVTGVNWNAKVLSCKFLDASGSGSDGDAIACFNYILALKQHGINIRVTSNSWGGARGTGPPAAALQNAIDALGAAGILNVFAAGNSNVNTDITPFDPASMTSASIVSVAASDSSDNRASFSNYGVTSVDIAAPGVNITSTFGSDYMALNGTSMAAPHVAGAAALLSAIDPTLSMDSLKFVLLNQAEKLPQWNGVVASGGRLNLLNAATAIAPAPSRVNVALSANGATAIGSSTQTGGDFSAGSAINGDRRGYPWGGGGAWADSTSGGWPDWLEVDFAGSRTINEIDVFSLQDNYSSPTEPSSSMTFTTFGLTDFEVQYWNGSSWVPVPGGTITNNNLVWRQVSFAALTTAKIRVWVTHSLYNYSRIAEVEAYTTSGAANSPPTVTLTAPANGASFTAPATINFTATAGDTDGSVANVGFYANGTLVGSDATNPYAFTWSGVAAGTYTLTAVATDDKGSATTSASATVTVSPPPGRTNVALAANGGTATASSTGTGGDFSAGSAINGDRRGYPWGGGGAWADSTSSSWPDWLEVDFAGAQTINEVDVFSLQDNYSSPANPTPSMTFTTFGLTDFEVQYWNGSGWVPVPGGTITNNNLVWRQISFSALTTAKIRVWVTHSLYNYSRIAEVEAYSTGGPANNPPTVTLTAPTTGATYTAPATINFTATAGDTDGSVTNVGFYANGTLMGSDATSPYAFSWSGVAAGTYVLTAVATDDQGSTTTSASATVTVSPPAGRTNVALAANGGTATASSTGTGGDFSAGSAINGDRRGYPWGGGGAWADSTSNTWPDWLEVDFAGSQTINEVDVFSLQDNYSSPSNPTPSMTFTTFGLTDFEVQYWNGSGWVPVPGGTITNNNLVWRQISFSALTTAKIRVWVTHSLFYYSRIAEVEAYSTGGPGNIPPTVTLSAPATGASFTAPATINFTATAGDTDGSVTNVGFYANGTLVGSDATSPYAFSWSGVAAGTYVLTAVATDDQGSTTTSTSATVTVSPPPGRTNVALAANGGTATASSTGTGGDFSAGSAINGDRRGYPWGGGGAWADSTSSTWPDWLEVDFAGSQSINEVDVFSLQDNYNSPIEPTSSLTFTTFGLTDFEVQYWNGSAWTPVPGGTITNNNLVWRQISFAALTTSKIRVWVTHSLYNYSRIAEVEAYSTGASSTSPPAVAPSTITLRADVIGSMPTSGNVGPPVVAGSNLLLFDQYGTVFRWTGSAAQPILTLSDAPSGVSPEGYEAIMNVAANSAGTSVYVMFQSATVPAGVPQKVSPRPGANDWQVLYRYDFNGTALSNPHGIVALQVRSGGHTGGGMVVLSSGLVLYATGDNGDAGEDGREYAQDVSNHLSKILQIDPATGAVTVLAVGVRNVQRLFVNPNGSDPRLEFGDIGGWIAEEFNSVRLADLLTGPVKNFGWGRNAGDGLAREGTFYIDPEGEVTGAAPMPENGFIQPIAQFGREAAGFIAMSGPVSSTSSFTNITALFGDLVSGNVYAVTGAPGTQYQTVFHVNLVDSGLAPVTLSGLAGGRPDPRFFLFPDGTAGVLLENTGVFYRLTQIGQ